jgi:hypothetical protein
MHNKNGSKTEREGRQEELERDRERMRQQSMLARLTGKR